MMAKATSRGRFIWHTLMTTDPKAALDFYTRVVGWKAEPWDKDPSYTVLLANSGRVGGVMNLPAEARAAGTPPNWLSYIETPDLKATVDAAGRLGARVIKPITELPDGSRLAVLADPQGSVFAAFTPFSPTQVNDPPKPGEFSWHELITTDYNAGLRFYQELFGWEKLDAMDLGSPVGVYQLFGWGGKSMGGAYNKPKEMPAPPHWMPYAMVPDTRKAADTLTQAGGKVIAGPLEVPGGDLIVLAIDPQGAAFAVHSAAPTPAKTREPATAGRR
jgi:predicted enzyme related to lactoylglutathione lyase